MKEVKSMGTTAYQFKTFVVAHKGNDYIIFRIEDIACFYTKNKLVFLLDKEGQKHLLDESLSQLEKDLNPALFFRANRQWIVHLQYIRKFRTYQRLRIQIELSMPIPFYIVTSQLSTFSFRKWIFNR